MTGRSEIELVLDRFLADGPETVADRAVASTLAEIDRTPQRRGLSAPWRFLEMTFNVRLAAAAIAAVALIGGALYVVGPRLGPGGPSPSPSTAVTAAPVAVATQSSASSPSPTQRMTPPPFTQTFTSSLYGYSVMYPSGWDVRPGSGPFPGTYIPTDETREADSIRLEEMGFLVVAAPVPAGTTESAWSKSIDRQVPPAFTFARSCPQATTKLVVGGEAATELSFDVCPVATFMWVTTVHAGYGYQIWWTDYADVKVADAQALFDGFLKSFRFTR